jgi:hypothetical protein
VLLARTPARFVFGTTASTDRVRIAFGVAARPSHGRAGDGIEFRVSTQPDGALLWSRRVRVAQSPAHENALVATVPMPAGQRGQAVAIEAVPVTPTDPAAWSFGRASSSSPPGRRLPWPRSQRLVNVDCNERRSLGPSAGMRRGRSWASLPACVLLHGRTGTGRALITR